MDLSFDISVIEDDMKKRNIPMFKEQSTPTIAPVDNQPIQFTKTIQTEGDPMIRAGKTAKHPEATNHRLNIYNNPEMSTDMGHWKQPTTYHTRTVDF